MPACTTCGGNNFRDGRCTRCGTFSPEAGAPQRFPPQATTQGAVPHPGPRHGHVVPLPPVDPQAALRAPLQREITEPAGVPVPGAGAGQRVSRQTSPRVETVRSAPPVPAGPRSVSGIPQAQTNPTFVPGIPGPPQYAGAMYPGAPPPTGGPMPGGLVPGAPMGGGLMPGAPMMPPPPQAPLPPIGVSQPNLPSAWPPPSAPSYPAARSAPAPYGDVGPTNPTPMEIPPPPRSVVPDPILEIAGPAAYDEPPREAHPDEILLREIVSDQPEPEAAGVPQLDGFEPTHLDTGNFRRVRKPMERAKTEPPPPMPVSCTRCGTAVLSMASVFCDTCGARLPIAKKRSDGNDTRRCLQCGYRSPAASAFCENCGLKFR